ncbi:MAG: hypothetical protein JWM93_207 [Frankiales bacterium]|nr:hypothetical protein [Frankiales bacterium]
MRKSVRSLFAAAVVGIGVLGVAGSASAAAPTGDFVNFKYCPYTNPAVSSCVYSKITSGSFKLGNANVPITASTPITLQGGIGQENYPNGAPFFPAVGAPSLSPTKLKVPGGLIGLVDTGGFGGFLISLFNAAVASVNDVYATAEPAGLPGFYPTQILFTGEQPGLKLPIRVHLENPFLGSNCYIGSTSNPIVLKLQSGTTAPPPPNTPISGSFGSTTFNSAFTVGTTVGLKLVDNSFAAPAATGCGFLPLDMLLITAAVNLKEGLPSAAGKNTAIQQGDSQIGDASLTAASVQ